MLHPGLPVRDIYPVQNYASEHSLTLPIDILALRLIKAAVRRVECYLKDHPAAQNCTSMPATPPPYDASPASVPVRLDNDLTRIRSGKAASDGAASTQSCEAVPQQKNATSCPNCGTRNTSIW